jgi:glucose/arabinose dehydrogenase
MRSSCLVTQVSALLLSLCIGLTGCRKPQQQQKQSAQPQPAQPQQQQRQQQGQPPTQSPPRQEEQQQAQLSQPPPQPQFRPHQQLSATGRAELNRIMDGGTLKDLRWPMFGAYKSEAVKFYKSLGGRFAWIADSQPTPQARQMIQILQHADEKGLDPEDYDRAFWQQRLDAFGGANKPDEPQQVHFDLALTISAMRYLEDVSRGRMNPEAFGFEVYIKPGGASR